MPERYIMLRRRMYYSVNTFEQMSMLLKLAVQFVHLNYGYDLCPCHIDPDNDFQEGI